MLESRRSLWIAVSLAVLFLGVSAASAQPYGSWLALHAGVGPAPTTGYVAVPTSSDFNFGSGFTFEAWVAVSDIGGCSSLFGNGWTISTWVGVCGTTLRSYTHGTTSLRDGGTVPANQWTHIAVTFDGTTRRHFVDGEEVMTFAETGPIPTTTNELRIGSDVSYERTPNGAMDEVRIWSVARTKAELRTNITRTINAAQAGLIAVYHFDAGATDAVGSHHGVIRGTAGYLNPPAGGSCTANATTLCLSGGRFAVSAKFIDPGPGTTGDARVVPGASADSGLFWFFSADNWELLVKALNGCGVNNRKWVFSAATTNVHYQLVATDTLFGTTKRYINFAGDPAPAVTDVAAFSTCP